MKFLVKPKVSEKFASCGKQCDRCNQCYVR